DQVSTKRSNSAKVVLADTKSFASKARMFEANATSQPHQSAVNLNQTEFENVIPQGGNGTMGSPPHNFEAQASIGDFQPVVNHVRTPENYQAYRLWELINALSPGVYAIDAMLRRPIMYAISFGHYLILGDYPVPCQARYT
ncbi:hypothetical protein L0F63_005852, partial [Massospora cicadina]